jgi:hypothetical protein
MPTIAEVLKAEGVSDEDAKVLIDNPKFSLVLESFRQKAEAGETAFQRATQLEADMKRFNAETVIPYGLKADQKVAAAEAELAKHRAYLKSMKDQGYDIPDAYLAGPTEPPKVEPSPTTDAWKDDVANAAKANMALISMSEKARDLLGHGLDVEQEYEDFGKNRRPNENLRSYIDRKYDLTAKENERKAKEKSDYEEKLRKEGEERYAKLHPKSESPDLATPRSSKHDKFENIAKERQNSWQTVQGREEATRARQEKYRDLLVQ